MNNKNDAPLLLLDNSSMHVLGNGFYKIEPVSFQEARNLIEMFEQNDVLKCYTDRTIDQVIHDYCGVMDKKFDYKKIRQMRPGQMAIVFKQYIMSSDTQPLTRPEEGVEAKKIQNVYVYCECITRLASDVFDYFQK